MYINSGKSKCSSEVVYKVKLFLWSNVSLVMMCWIAKQSEIILSVLLIFWFTIKKIFWGLEFYFFFFLYFSFFCEVFFELVVRQMFRSDILLGFLLRFYIKNTKCLSKLWVAIFYFPLIVLLWDLSLQMCLVGVMSISFTWLVSFKNVHRCLYFAYVNSRASV